jgi:hypothetical protein
MGLVQFAAVVLTFYDADGRAVREYELAPDDLDTAFPRQLVVEGRTMWADLPDHYLYELAAEDRVPPSGSATWTITAPKVTQRLPQSGVVIPSAEQLGRAAYRAWCVGLAGRAGPLAAWDELREWEQDCWRLAGTIVAGEVSSATLRQRAPSPAEAGGGHR